MHIHRAHIHTLTHTHTHMRTLTHTHTHTQLHTHTCTHTCTHTRAHNTHVHTHTRAHTHNTHTHTCAHTHTTHTHTYTCTHTQLTPSLTVLFWCEVQQCLQHLCTLHHHCCVPHALLHNPHHLWPQGMDEMHRSGRVLRHKERLACLEGLQLQLGEIEEGARYSNFLSAGQDTDVSQHVRVSRF